MRNTGYSICQSRKPGNGLIFDPRTKIILLIELDILLFLGHSLAYETSVFLFCAFILLVGGQNKTALKCAGTFFLFVLTEQLIQPYLATSFVSLVHFIVVVVRKVLPAFMLAKWLIATTEASAFVAAMRKCKIPKDAIVTTSVIFRCFPTISEEWGSIKTAMKMRGIEFNLKNMVTRPSETMIRILVPLFVSALNISDELAAAALCRGLDNPGTHTCITQIHFRWYDIAFLLFVTVSFAVICVLNIRGYSL